MWHILFQAFVKYCLHSKHLNKYYLKSSTLVFCNIFLRPSRIQVPLLKKYKLIKKNASTKQLLLYTTQNSHTYQH